MYLPGTLVFEFLVSWLFTACSLSGTKPAFYKLNSILRQHYGLNKNIMRASWEKIYSVLGRVAKRVVITVFKPIRSQHFETTLSQNNAVSNAIKRDHWDRMPYKEIRFHVLWLQIFLHQKNVAKKSAISI